VKLNVSSSAAASIVFFGILVCSAAPARAGELTADYGFPQIRDIWQNDGAGPVAMIIEVTPVGGAICTVSAHPGGSSKRFDSDTGSPQKMELTVQPKGGIEVRAEKGAPKAAKAGEKPGAAEATKCVYSVTQSTDLSH